VVETSLEINVSELKSVLLSLYVGYKFNEWVNV